MFSNRTPEGRNNIVGVKVAAIRKSMHISQRQLADNLKALGLEVDKNAVQRMESGQRFVIDTELEFLAKALNTTILNLLDLE